MASIIRIKRSSVSGNPSTLGAGELAYSALNGAGGNRLYIGMGTETAGNAVNHHVIGGTYYTGLVDASVAGTLTTSASSIPVLSATGTIDKWLVGNLTLNGSTVSSTGELILSSANGVVLNNSEFIAGGSYGGNRLYLPTGGGATLRSGYEGGVSLQAATDGSTFVTLNLAASGTLTIPGAIVSTSGSNANISITPDGTGKLVLNNPYINGTTDTLAEYILDTVGGAITAGTGVTITNSDVGNTSTVSITNTAVTAGSYGSATQIPTFTVNAQGQLTAAGTAALATTLNVAGDTGTSAFALLTDTMTFVGGTGITSVVGKVGSATSVTLNIDSTVATLTGSQTLTNKSINLANNTLTATSAQLLAAMTDETGTGSLVFATSPTLVTPVLGVASATTINKVAFTAPATGSTLTIADGKTLTASNTLTFTGTDGSSAAFGNGGTVAYVANKLSAFAATTSAELAGVITDETGTGSLVFASSPTLVTPTLGAALATSVTATSGNLTLAAAAGNNSVSITPTGTGTVDVANKRITSVAEPTQSTDAATKNYVDAVKTGLDPKDSVRIATTAELTATYSNGASGVGATLTNSGTQAAFTVDSIVGVIGDRVLVKDQANALQNGIYSVTTVGTASTNWVLTRTLDADQDPEVTPGAFTFVEEGTINGSNGFVCTTTGTITIGTTNISWVQFSGAGQVIAGDGLTKTGNTLNAVGTSNRISISADAIDIASTYVGQTSITTLGTITSGTWNAGIVSGQYGGTGVNNSGKTITLGGNVSHAGAFTQTFTATANTSVTLPTTGTLATLAGSESLSNKTITASSFSGTTIAASGLITFTNTTDATALNVAAVELDGGLSVAKSMFIGLNITGAGAATSTLDGFNIDGGTY